MADRRATRFRLGGTEYVVLREPADEPRWGALTPAEREVAEGVLAGCSNAQIASLRGTSASTVVNQLSAVYRKLGVASRFELIALATGKPTP